MITKDGKIPGILPKLGLGVMGGTLLSSLLSTLFGVGATVFQNKYNSPQAQLKRLRQAGLPLSYMYQGKVNQQSDSPKLSLDPTLGILSKLQGTKLTSDTTAQNIANYGAEEDQRLLGGTRKMEDGTTMNNREYKFGVDRETKRLEYFLKSNEKELSDIELQLEEGAFGEGISMEMKRQTLAKVKQQIANMLEQAGLMGQLQKIRGLEETLNNSLTEDLENMPDFVSALLKILLIATKR